MNKGNRTLLGVQKWLTCPFHIADSLRAWGNLSPGSTWDGDGVDTWIEYRQL